MQRESASPLLRFVIGAAVGTLVGLCFFRMSLWFIPVGAAIGGLIGLSTRVVGTPAGEELAQVGCQTLGCLVEAWLMSGCVGCVVVVLAVLGAAILGAVALFAG